jgi:hypothetical protein
MTQTSNLPVNFDFKQSKIALYIIMNLYSTFRLPLFLFLANHLSYFICTSIEASLKSYYFQNIRVNCKLFLYE